ncbi:hypothetical protein J8273_2110 [Carpediemonas membranifera]|uniref:Uncharacterized protein n=1 Tax=Carpediemonas membranifera TaxID=201153 RepID=A0A8J6B8E3_9EUKA|nr:hypothetical protein J8273_2110 [Carpediemonas membranifera]|eukprot:KAG9396379.1 hypothetical protein J8273_2110 [Carpediemonas membranifera]
MIPNPTSTNRRCSSLPHKGAPTPLWMLSASISTTPTDEGTSAGSGSDHDIAVLERPLGDCVAQGPDDDADGSVIGAVREKVEEAAADEYTGSEEIHVQKELIEGDVLDLDCRRWEQNRQQSIYQKTAENNPDEIDEKVHWIQLESDAQSLKVH